MVAGRSGSGKTTLLRACCGLVPHYHGGQIAGVLQVGGLDVRDHGPAALGGVVGVVAQDPETQVVSTTVRGELELPLEMRGESPAARARAVEEVALALAIPELLDRPVDTLSGRRAPTGGSGSRVGRPAAPGAAGRADVSARPGRRRRVDRPPAPTERGVGDGRHPRGAPVGALPVGRRSGRSPWRMGGLGSTASPARSSSGPSEPTPLWPRPPHGCSISRDSARPPTASKRRESPCAEPVSSRTKPRAAPRRRTARAASVARIAATPPSALETCGWLSTTAAEIATFFAASTWRSGVASGWP